MMKRTIGIISILLLFGNAYAENLPLDNELKGNSKILSTEWTGLYGGLNADVFFNRVNLNSHHDGFIEMNGTCNISTHFNSFSPGAQIGYIQEYDSKIALGIEGSVNYNTNQTPNLNCNCPINPNVSDHFSFSNRAEGSLRGRIGYALSDYRMLPFLTVGGSLANLGLKYTNENGDHYSTHHSKAGWLVGAGVEWKIAPKWSLRADYYYTAYRDLNMGINKIYGLIDPNGAANASLYANTLNLAINYWY